MALLESEKAFILVKLFLIVFHILILVSLIIYLIYYIIILVNLDPKQQSYNDLEAEYHLIIIFTSTSILFEIFGLIGIVLENKCILILFILLSGLVVIINTLSRGFGYGLIGVVVTFMTGYYAYMCGRYHKNQQNKLNTSKSIII